jgi:arylsulfatase A-like enzyme
MTLPTPTAPTMPDSHSPPTHHALARSVTLFAVASLLGTVLHAAESAPTKATTPLVAKRPNFLLIVADDLGFSDLGAFGGEIDTPNLDALAKEGLRLTDFHSAATCSPTRAMLLSGVDHHLAGLGTMAERLLPEQQGKPGYEGFLNDSVVAFPELLRNSGYHTYMAGKWHLGLSEPLGPKARGFEKSFALLRGSDDHVAQPWSTTIDPSEPYYREDGQLTTVPADFYSSDFFASKLLSYLKAKPADGGPFFAYLAFTAPHWPLQAPAEVIAKYEQRYLAGYDAIREARLAKQKALGIIPADFQHAFPRNNLWPTWRRLSPARQAQEARRMAIYAAMVDVMDRNIGRVIQQLKDSGQYENTVIVFISDNGAEGGYVGDRPSKIPRDNSLANLGKASSFVSYGPNWAQVSATPFTLFKGFAYEGGTTVPTIIRYPASLAAGKVNTTPGHVTDIAPTLLQLAGVSYPDKVDGRELPRLQGRSLLPLLTGQGADKGTQALNSFEKGWELFGQKAYRQGDWKVVYSPAPFGNGRWQLYNVKHDRGEVIDLANHHPERAAALVAEYGEYVKRNGVQDSLGLAERIRGNRDERVYFETLPTPANSASP